MALVDVERRDHGIVLVTLNDPDRRNAMTVDMGEAIEATFSDLAREEDVRVVVLTGAPPAFSAGGDLAIVAEDAKVGLNFARLALESLPQSEVLPRALELAGEIAASAPLVVRQLKRALAVSPTNALDEQLDLEAANQAVNYGTQDLQEGLAAGHDRRPPGFTGR